MNAATTPCACRLNREAAMTCPRTNRGTLVWAPISVLDDGTPVGPIEAVDLSGNREVLTFGHEWVHFEEDTARDHADIRHLTFEVADA